MSLKAFYKSDFTLKATLTDEAGNAVAGATVKVVIVKKSDGTEVLSEKTMNDDGGGNYSYQVAEGTLGEKNTWYTAQVTALDGSTQRYAEVGIYNQPDPD